MLFSHKIQILSISTFLCGIFLSIALLVVILMNVPVPDNAKLVCSKVLGTIVCVSALAAPFSKEKVEDETVRLIRFKTIAYIVAVCFCLLVIESLVYILFAGPETLIPSAQKTVTGLGHILFVEIVYFVVLKVSVSHHRK